ncbi:MAG TPA: DUF4340 domain-containing protein [Gemmataceae bacterium]|nr:DUF4340 domain-containing protein [Gemmataceae bacterium]
MSFKTTYILFGLLAVVLLAFILTLWMEPSTPDSGTYVLPSLHNKAKPIKEDDITRVEIERSKPETEKLVFVRDSGSRKWRIVEPRDYQTDSAAVDHLVRQVFQASLDTKADVLNKPQQYGLDEPAEVVTLVKEAEPRREVKLNVGDTSPGSQNAVIYVTSSDRKEVMAVKKSELDTVKKSLADFRARELLSPSTGDIQTFTLLERNKGKDIKGPLELKKGSEERWAYVKPSYGDAHDKGANPAGEDKAPTNVESVLSDISSLKIESDKDFVKDDAADLGEYNLDPAKDDILRIEVERVESVNKDEKGDKKTERKKVALVVGVGKKVDDKNDQYYAYIDDPKHKDIIKIASKSVARFLKLVDKPDALRERTLVALGGFHKPDAINIENSWGKLEFRRTSSAAAGPRGMAPPESWKLWRGDKSYAVDATAVQTLISTLTAPNQVSGFVDDAATIKTLIPEKPETVVRIWTDSLPAEDKKKDDKKEDKKDKKPEPKDKPAFTLSFGRTQEGKAAVERKRGDAKTGTVVLVSTKVRDQVQEGPLAYLDKQLPPFTGIHLDHLKDVTKLTLTRDGTKYEISREDKADAPWKIDQPKDFAGRTADKSAVEDILRDLNNLRAVKIVSDKAPEAAKLTEWGLKDPRLKAVVTRMVDKKPKTYEFDFGKDADGGVYLRASQQDMIVVAGSNVVNTLKRELQDPTVFHFDAGKVQEVKVSGWISLQKQLGKDKPLTLMFKRAKGGSGWEIEPKDAIKPDASRMDSFLKNLSELKAVKFVAHKAKPSSDQELDVNKGALLVELMVAGEKTPRTLTVGKADGNTGYFAISNQLPGDIFEVRKDLFDKVKEKPAYFSGQ